MRHHIWHNFFTASSVLSLLLCLGLVGLWIRSCCVDDRIDYSTISQQGPSLVAATHGLCLRRGAIEYSLLRITYGAKTPPEALPSSSTSGQVKWRTRSRAKGLPFRWFRFSRARSNVAAPAIMDITEVFTPFWFPCLLTAVPPVLWLRRTRRYRRRAKLGLCLTCGYDIRASKDQCPECGTPIPRSSRATPHSLPSSS